MDDKDLDYLREEEATSGSGRPNSPPKKSRSMKPKSRRSRPSPSDEGGNNESAEAKDGPPAQRQRSTKKHGSSSTTRSTTLNGNEIKARMQRRGSVDVGSSRRSALDSGSNQHVRTQRRQSMSSAPLHGTTSAPNHKGPQSRGTVTDNHGGDVIHRHKSLPGAASELLRSTHEKLKSKVEKAQNKIAELQAEIAAADAEMNFL